MTIESIVDAQIAARPWSEAMESLAASSKNFNKRKGLMMMFSELEGRE
jgi:hypothetical protein